MVQKLTVPVGGEPDLRERTILARVALVYSIEPFRSLVLPLLNLIPQLLPSAALESSLTLRIDAIETIVDNMREMPCHLVSPSRIQS